MKQLKLTPSSLTLNRPPQVRRRLALCGLVLALLLSACAMGATTPEPTPVLVDDFETLVSVTGKVAPAVWTTVGAQTGGIVVEVLIEEGAQVAAGDVLVRLDDADAQMALRQAEATLAAAAAQLARAEIGARPEEVAVAEAQALAAQTLISQTLAQRNQLSAGASEADIAAADAGVAAATAQYDIAVAQIELLKADVLPQDIAIAEAPVAQAQVAVEAAQVALARAVVTAPFAGTVTRIDVRRGEFIAPGQPLITLGDLSTLRIQTTDLDEIDVARISEGQIATLTFDALPALTLTGQVTRIAPMAEPGGGGVNYTVIIEPGEVPPQIRWGMTVFIDINVNP